MNESPTEALTRAVAPLLEKIRGDEEQAGQDAHERDEEDRLYAEFLKDLRHLRPDEEPF